MQGIAIRGMKLETGNVGGAGECPGNGRHLCKPPTLSASLPTAAVKTRRALTTGLLMAALALVAIGLTSTSSGATIVKKTVTYEHEGTTLEGFLAYDDAVEGSRPGVLIVHQWMGLTDNERMRAEMLAQMGYVAFAADIYGKGIRPANQEEAGAEAGKYYSDRPLLRRRVAAGIGVLEGKVASSDGGGAIASVDPTRIAAIGYCFGGGAVLELARSGAEIAGVVSFHGSLDTPNPEDAKDIRCPLLVLHGAEDPYVPIEKVTGFLDEMKAGGADFQFVAYSGAVHSFTQKAAGDDKTKGAAYNAKADARSWQAMKDFFAEIF